MDYLGDDGPYAPSCDLSQAVPRDPSEPTLVPVLGLFTEEGERQHDRDGEPRVAEEDGGCEASPANEVEE